MFTMAVVEFSICNAQSSFTVPLFKPHVLYFTITYARQPR